MGGLVQQVEMLASDRSPSVEDISSFNSDLRIEIIVRAEVLLGVPEVVKVHLFPVDGVAFLLLELVDDRRVGDMFPTAPSCLDVSVVTFVEGVGHFNALCESECAKH